MSRYWTCYWQFSYWRPDVNAESEPVDHCGSNSFRRRGISVGDVVYIVSVGDGQLYLGGRMTVQQIVSRSEAVRILNNDNLFDTANEWLVDQAGSGTPLHLHRRLAPAVSKRLRFLSPTSETKELVFNSDTHLDNQTIRGVRELAPDSAVLLDRIIDITDQLPRKSQPIVVIEKLLASPRALEGQEHVRLPEEVPSTSAYNEGSVQQILVNRYERDPRAREECIRHYGTTCFLCGFDFVAAYGEVMAGFIHVHHLKLLSGIGGNYQVDPIQDLRPVCPNCHAVLHRRDPPYSLDDIQHFLKAQANSAKKKPSRSSK